MQDLPVDEAAQLIQHRLDLGLERGDVCDWAWTAPEDERRGLGDEQHEQARRPRHDRGRCAEELRCAEF